MSAFTSTFENWFTLIEYEERYPLSKVKPQKSPFIPEVGSSLI